METLNKIDVLKDTITDLAQMDLLLEKLLEITPLVRSTGRNGAA
jgi:hypothetical protein